ncbi:hypothetical protein FJSC11DRAFT_1773 [Fischerella thermalis JSC-11]|jgi:hypothetical protein|uniref:Uncharacterized protein n=1 Tax=Fischerella thermalis JSC-11 TaxID=741277 RepID=G6FSM6_9CYAN|nr:hypothetical protein FJSC11DRAFT_1773 [Fischerella thermalis JSC-11]
MESIEVGPQQYPHIYALGEDCAHRLGIGVPQIFIQHFLNAGVGMQKLLAIAPD